MSVFVTTFNSLARFGSHVNSFCKLFFARIFNITAFYIYSIVAFEVRVEFGLSH